jgi:predicted membrane-bound spermidine synthase
MQSLQNTTIKQPRALLLLFFLSGSTALIYQVIWQKLLFTAFGVDLQSTAIVVSTFMLGLGLGALVGGQFAEKYPNDQLLFFIFVEMGIGLFGFASYDVIRFVAESFFEHPLVVIAAVNFLLLLFPTLLMGATLPVLVSHLYKQSRNVGTSIGSLYFSNTCGAALGCFFGGFILLNFFSYSETLVIAAITNMAVAALAYLFIYRVEIV